LEEAKKIDLTKNYFIFIALGQRNSGGFGIKINEIYCKNKKLCIKYAEIKPPKDAMLTMALTYPILIGTIPNKKCKKFEFIKE
jgi:hypothetical protein